VSGPAGGVVSGPGLAPVSEPGGDAAGGAGPVPVGGSVTDAAGGAGPVPASGPVGGATAGPVRNTFPAVRRIARGSTGAGDAVVRAEGLGKRFGSVWALADVSFSVGPGRVLGLLGPNGAGKTTTVRILATLCRPDRGTATVAGWDVVRHPERVRSATSLAGQYAAVDQQLTGRENLRLVGRLHHMGRAAAERADELLVSFGLLGAADRPVRTYSGGMRRRLDLAASVVNRPAVLFLDEPTTGLDPTSRAAMWRSVRDLVADGTTVVLTTQYLEEADQLCDGLVVVDRGAVVATGSPDELKTAVGGDVIEMVLDGPLAAQRAAAVAARCTGTRATVDVGTSSVVVPVGRGAAPALAVTVRHLAEVGIVPVEIGVRRPSLDEVFVALTGHRTRDGDAAPGAPASAVPAGAPASAVPPVCDADAIAGASVANAPSGPRRGSGVGTALALGPRAALDDRRGRGIVPDDEQRSGIAPDDQRGAGIAPYDEQRSGVALDDQLRPRAAPDDQRGSGIAVVPADGGVVAAALAAAGLDRPSPGPTERLGSQRRVRRVLGDWGQVAWRNAVHVVRQPINAVFLLVQPVMFVVMFRYVFGGALALAVGRGRYVEFLLPGIVAQTMAFGSMSTAVGLAEDLGSGMVDRIRSMPVARSAILAGRLLADGGQYLVVMAVMVAIGSLVGFRFEDGPAAAVAMVAMALAFGLVASAFAALVGIRTRDPQGAMTVGLTALFPVCFVSGAFVPLATLPGWLQPVARANPVTVVVEAMRALASGGPVALRCTEALAWMVVLTVVLSPLAVRALRRTA
jgi:ABC-2 type transport system ATP-binding protein